jgi:hypothetical protein
MNATFHWNAFAARLQAVGFQDPHVSITGNHHELEAIDKLLRYLRPELAEDAAAVAALAPASMEPDPVQQNHFQHLPRVPKQYVHADAPWRYPAGEWRQSE